MIPRRMAQRRSKSLRILGVAANPDDAWTVQQQSPQGQMVLSWRAQYGSCSARLSTLLVALRGRSWTSSTEVGHWKCASLDRQKAMTSVAASSAPVRGRRRH
jgi:hypothetical protein